MSQGFRGWRRALCFGPLAIALGAACSSRIQPPAPATAPATRVALTRSVHPWATPANDQGRLDPDRVLHHLSLVFKLTPEQERDRDALVAEQQRPGSPSFHHWLTPEEYAARFGASPADLARASDWLRSQGLSVLDTSRLGARVTFSGTVAQIETAFQTELHRYQVGGEQHYAMDRAPSLPADLGERVLAVYNAHDFYPKHAPTEVRVATPKAVCPAGTIDCTAGAEAIAPPDWETIYDVKSLYSTGVDGTHPITGQGVTIAVVGLAEIAQADLTSFRGLYGLAANPITMTLVPGTGTPQAANGAGIEAVLDTEWSGAIAPEAAIHYVFNGGEDGNVFDAIFYALEENYGAILSVSFGGCEAGASPADADVLQVYGSVASLLGTSFVAASGDQGATACGGDGNGTGGLYVDMPAAYPEVTAVGGTGFVISTGQLTFSDAGFVSARGVESVWNERHNGYAGGISAGGGGISSVFARPAYQGAINTCAPVGSLPTGVTAADQRQVPDVAFTAAEGISQYGILVECTYDGSDCTAGGTNPVLLQIGGTSASTPSFAGVLALANQAMGGRLGNVNPMLYTLNQSAPAAFHDITVGNNEVICHTGDPGCPGNDKLYGFAAAAGYDCASGLGSVDATSLLTAWYGLTPTTTAISATPTSSMEGGSVSLTATVDVSGSNANALGGTVTFTFQSYLANGDLDLSWELGSVALDGGTGSGTATLTTAIPPGMVGPIQAVDVYARYGGDLHHLGSYSAAEQETFSPVQFCVTPAVDSVPAGTTLTVAGEGGVPPYRYYIDWDSTCGPNYSGCSSLGVTTGTFVAGTGAGGYVVIQAFDADGVDTFAEITVAGGGGTVPWSDAGPGNYSGVRVSAVPLTACPSGDSCGTVPDGCGGTTSCGTCSAPQTCGGGAPSNPNQCGCTPTTSSCPSGDTCGTVPNGCGGTISCGTCSAPQTCGGGTPSNPNQCGCSPTTSSCPSGDACGTLPNGCGGTISCGTCGGSTPLCNGSHQCVQCLTASDCSSTSPVCGVNGTCQPCTLDSQCSGNTPACEPSGACGQCSASNQTECVAPTSVCDTATATCVGCESDSQCGGTTPVCDTTTLLCGPCSVTEPCSATDGGSACVVTGPRSGQCVDCVANSDCPSPLLCDVATNVCVGCLASTDCGGSTPVCSTTDSCVACQQDFSATGRPDGGASCPSAEAPACTSSGTCAPCSATNLSACSAPGVCQEPATCSAQGTCNALAPVGDGTPCPGGVCSGGSCAPSGSSTSSGSSTHTSTAASLSTSTASSTAAATSSSGTTAAGTVGTASSATASVSAGSTGARGSSSASGVVTSLSSAASTGATASTGSTASTSGATATASSSTGGTSTHGSGGTSGHAATSSGSELSAASATTTGGAISTSGSASSGVSTTHGSSSTGSSSGAGARPGCGCDGSGEPLSALALLALLARRRSSRRYTFTPRRRRGPASATAERRTVTSRLAPRVARRSR